MARPRKNNLLYFSHDADASEHPKFIALRAHYGGEKGRAMEQRFWQLNGMIAKSEGCRLDLGHDFIKPSVAQKLELSLADLDEFLSFLADPQRCDLINNDRGVIWTDRCDEELTFYLESHEKDRARKPKKKSNPKDSTGLLPFSNGNPIENIGFPRRKEGSKGLEEGEGIPHSSPSAPQEGIAMIPEILEIHKRATRIELVIPESEMTILLALFREHGGAPIVAAYRLHQKEKPGKAFRFFLADFAEYFARLPQPPKVRGPECPECKLHDGLHIRGCSLANGSSGSPGVSAPIPRTYDEETGERLDQPAPPLFEPEDDFENDVPVATAPEDEELEIF